MAGSSLKWDDRKLKKEVAFTTEQKMIKAGFMIEKDAKYFVKIDTGRLRSSISVNWTGSGMTEGKIENKAKPGDGIKQPTSKPKEFSVVVGSNVNYAIPQEFGTSKQSAHPYLRPALAKNLTRIRQLFGRKR